MTAQEKQHTKKTFHTFFISILLTSTLAIANGQSTVPNRTLPNVRGGTFYLRAQSRQPLLLAFLQTVPDTANTPSRSQVVFLSSMAHQYGPRGLRVAIVDASALVLASPPSYDALVNASYDWQIKFPLLLDQNARLARKLKIEEIPTTFLISANGKILQRWDGLTRPAVLAISIEKLLGGPIAQTP